MRSINLLLTYLLTDRPRYSICSKRPLLLQRGLIIQNGTQKNRGHWSLCNKNVSLYPCPQLHQILTSYQNFFTVKLSNKSVIKTSLKMTPYLKCVITLACEMSDFFDHQQQMVIFCVIMYTYTCNSHHLTMTKKVAEN